MTRQAVTPDKLPVSGPLSQAIRAYGLIFLSGQIGRNPVTGKLVEGSVEDQAHQAFKNLASVLEAAGKSLDDVVRVGVYLTNMDDLTKVNGVYASYFSAPYPARTSIAVAALPSGADIELDMVVLDQSPRLKD